MTLPGSSVVRETSSSSTISACFWLQVRTRAEKHHKHLDYPADCLYYPRPSCSSHPTTRHSVYNPFQPSPRSHHRRRHHRRQLLRQKTRRYLQQTRRPRLLLQLQQWTDLGATMPSRSGLQRELPVLRQAVIQPAGRNTSRC